MNQNARIAIVDDSISALPYMAELVTAMFGTDTAIPFTDPVAALKWCGGHDIDVIIVDYVMPDIDGLQFIEKIRALPSRVNVPLVMVTTSDDRDVRYQALQLGATDFLQKPVDRIEFVTRIRNLFTLSRHHQQTADYAVHLAEDVRRATRDIVDREQETILVLSRAAEYRDNETGLHLLRMSRYCRFIAERLGLPADEIDIIQAAAPMHDIGKLGIPDHVLLKPGPLTDDERRIIERHPQIGWDILADSKARLLQVAGDIALYHHEKWDGTGYPRGVAGQAIPLVGRIVIVSDVFDALTSRRPYKEPWPLDDACAYLRDNSGTFFDPRCIDAFFNAMDDVHGVLKCHRQSDGT